MPPPLRAPASSVERPLDAGSLRSVFIDLLSRPPLATEREQWLGRERAELVEALLPTLEFWENWIEEQFYYFLLIDNFRPTNRAVLELPAALAEGRTGVVEALHLVCLSSNFDRRNPGPDTFVSVVMEQLRGMTVQERERELEIGKKVYDGVRGRFLGEMGSSQADVIHIAISGPRAMEFLLGREYERLVRDTPGPRDLKSWRATLQEDPLAWNKILRDWLLSEAYDARLETRVEMPNRTFVRALHVDLMDRLPDELEEQRLRAALDGLADSGPLRCLVARLLLDSGKAELPRRQEIDDPGAWVRGLFARLLGRAPGENEASVFVESLADPACRTETVVYAIVSSPEYQTW